KLFVPSARANLVPRQRLFDHLQRGLQGKLTLISAPAGFGKTTLVSAWIAGCGRPAAWLSLDAGESDRTRFLTYLVAALQTIAPTIGSGLVGVLQAPQPPPAEAILTALLNDLSMLPHPFVLVLDDYHLLDARPVDDALTFLLEHLPAQMHLLIVTREDPPLPLARFRARGHLTDVRAADLRFTPEEATGFLTDVMSLDLAVEDVAALEERTEGWIAGLQLAALSLQGSHDAISFIKSFTGSDHFVTDYLVEEVLHQQPARVQSFLLRTSVLARMCGPLCDAVLLDPTGSGQATLEYLDRANLFLISLDNERRWYRYHHLFADLLRQRLQQRAASSQAEAMGDVTALHQRASHWYEDNGLEIEAFQHAAAANDLARAEHLIEGAGMPLYFRGAGAQILNWLQSLPATVLQARPALWVASVTMLTFAGKQTVERELQAAEAALAQRAPGAEPGDAPRNLLGHIAALRAMLAIPQHRVETVLAQSRRAMEYLHPDNVPVRTVATWTLGYAYQLQGEAAAASRAFTEAIALSQASGNTFANILATGSLGQVQEADNQLHLAAASYQRVVLLAGVPPLSTASEALLGLARISYQWNDLQAAEQYGHQCLQLTRQSQSVDTFASYGVFLARLRLAQDDAPGAVAVLDEAEAFVRQHGFVFRMADVVAAQVLTLLRQGRLAAAAHLAQTHELPISQARVHLAQGDPSTALALLLPVRQQVEATGWADEWLRVLVIQAVAYYAHGELDTAMRLLQDALALARPGGFIRLFVDEGAPMAQLVSEAAARGMMPDQTERLLAAWDTQRQKSAGDSPSRTARLSPPLDETLSERELEILRLIAQGCSNREISERLFLAVDTIKGHNSSTYAKLGVQRRTEAVARA
ncbi:MAG TPA: LuxR C-terminal-related transcriptional regulator, partial [Herpetosiphonaceae bacterium]|nr:LuxR C-terminal-related transcriptional regulator [Herpetosiphonaceae bacterium]